MLRQLVAIVIAGALAAAVAGSITITRHLEALEVGLKSDTAEVRRIVDVQRAVQKQNEALTQLVTTTQAIGEGLDGVLETSDAIRTQVGAIKQANRATLQASGALEEQNHVAAAQLQRVLQALKTLEEGSTAIKGSLRSLQGLVVGDVEVLESIAVGTARMNARVPSIGR